MNRLNANSACVGTDLLTGFFFRKSAVTLFVTVMLLFAGLNSALSQMVSISARFDTTAILIGEQTNFIITVEQPDDMQIFFPLLKDTLTSAIEIIRSLTADTIRADNNMLQIKTGFRVTSFEPGVQYVKPLPFVFLVDGDEKVLYTVRSSIEVISPEVDLSEGIYDIKSPLGIPVGVLEVLRLLLPALLLLITGWYLYKLYRRRKGGQPAVESAGYTEPAHTIALRDLKLLREQSLWQKGRIKEYYTRLTGIIRVYIERRFSINAMEQTSDEILTGLSSIDFSTGETMALLKDLFTTADLVKFAKYEPGREDHEECLNTSFRFVKETFEDLKLDHQYITTSPDNTEHVAGKEISPPGKAGPDVGKGIPLSDNPGGEEVLKYTSKPEDEKGKENSDKPDSGTETFVSQVKSKEDE